MAATRYVDIYTPATYTLTIRFHRNGGSTVPSNQVYSRQYSGPVCPCPVKITSELPVRSGYYCTGYSEGSSSNPITRQPGDMFMHEFERVVTGSTWREYLDGDTTVHETTHTTQDQSVTIDLYAQWHSNNYSIVYDANGGTGAPEKQKRARGSEDFHLSQTRPTYGTLHFAGWATSPDGQPVYQPGDAYDEDADITLYAVWTQGASILDTVTGIVDIESSGSTSWFSKDSSFTHRLVISYGNAPEVAVECAAGVTSANFTIPATWYAALPNETIALATARLYTYSGDILVGSSSKTLYVQVPVGIGPTISSFTAAHHSENATVSGWGEFTQGYSQADLSVVATAGTGATIRRAIFSGPGFDYSTDEMTARTGVLDVSGDNEFTVTVKDSRGRSATATLTVSVYPYAPPVVFGIETMRADSDGTTDNGAGTHLKAKPGYEYSSVNGKNSLTAQTLSYKEHGALSPVAEIPCTHGTVYGPPGTMWAINLGNAYDVTVSLTDALGNTTTRTAVLPPAFGIWYGRGNDRIGLGGPPEGPGFWVSWDSIFKGDVTFREDAAFNGDAVFNGVVDVAKRRCVASLQSPGWYRALTYTTVNAEAKGSGFIIDMSISKDGIDSEAHKVSLFGVYGNIAFKDEASVSATQFIDKVRYTYETLGDHGYVDIHYTGSSPRAVVVNFDIKTKPAYQTHFAAGSLASVNDTPSGETVAAVKELAATSKEVRSLSDLGDYFTITAGNSTTIALDSSSRHMFFTSAQSNSSLCIVMVNVADDGTVNLKEIGDASRISATAGTNAVSISVTGHDTDIMHMAW